MSHHTPSFFMRENRVPRQLSIADTFTSNINTNDIDNDLRLQYDY
ncbi:hypothetical protein SSYIS1_28930 [Serratia symbiotica]|uniref:Uncharacterized protein n=1 Tax=Serratia symbiotica TaxID=138074 RepID=A0A455VV16_9GAMM|nr:hypothetical protein SSYIS1_28930 [Serratia symbiotica]